MTSAKSLHWSRVTPAGPVMFMTFTPYSEYCAHMLQWHDIFSLIASVSQQRCLCELAYRLGPISPADVSPRPGKVLCSRWRRNNCKLLPRSSCERSPWRTEGSFPHSSDTKHCRTLPFGALKTSETFGRMRSLPTESWAFTLGWLSTLLAAVYRVPLGSR